MDDNNVKKYPFVVSFYPGDKDDIVSNKSYYVAFAPDLPGCITCGEGESINDNLTSNCKDALKCWIEAFKEGNDNLFTPSDIKLHKIPEPSDIDDVRRKISIENSFVILVTATLDENN